VTQQQKVAMRKADAAIRKEKKRVRCMLDNMEIDKVKIPDELK
jgi:hypothetical protein